MKKKRIGCVISAIFLVAALLGALFALYYFYLVPRTFEARRETSGPPSVYVHTPLDGDTLPANTGQTARVTVTGRHPILKLEMWMDGDLLVSKVPDRGDQIAFEAYTDFQVTQGPHMLSWRAIDTAGLVGQSQPIAVMGEAQPGAGAPADDAAVGGAAPAQGAQDAANQAPAAPADGGGEPPANGGEGEGPGGGDGAQKQPSGDIWKAEDKPGIDWGKLNIALRDFPAAPSHLQVRFEGCSLYLNWNDNADNETHFNIWMQRLSGPAQLIKELDARPGTGQVYIDINAPQFGIYSFWVEAANALGAQPSAVKGVAVNENCSGRPATQLRIEALGMYGFDSVWDKIYCYVSFEGFPEERIPEGNVYFDLDPQRGADIHAWFGGKNSRIVQMPADEVLDIQGKCMGWLGSNPQPLGTFNESIPRELWDNRILQAKSINFVIDYRVEPYGALDAKVNDYGYTNHSIPRPIIESITPSEDTGSIKVAWTWRGDEELKADGYSIYINGSSRASASSMIPFGDYKKWDRTVILPTFCGETYKIKMTVNAGNAHSPFSQEHTFEQPPCRITAEVKFESVTSVTTSRGNSSCDQLDIHYMLAVLGSGGSFNIIDGGSPQAPIPYRCGIEYDFVRDLGAEKNTITLPINPNVPEIRLITAFWDGKDKFGFNEEDIKKFPYERWANVDEDFTLFSDFNGTAHVTVKGHIRGYLTPGQ